MRKAAHPARRQGNYLEVPRRIAGGARTLWPDDRHECIATPVPLLGIVVVLAVFSGMSTLAVKVGSAWLVAGLLYGTVLKAIRRAELHVPL